MGTQILVGLIITIVGGLAVPALQKYPWIKYWYYPVFIILFIVGDNCSCSLIARRALLFLFVLIEILKFTFSKEPITRINIVFGVIVPTITLILGLLDFKLYIVIPR